MDINLLAGQNLGRSRIGRRDVEKSFLPTTSVQTIKLVGFFWTFPEAPLNYLQMDAVNRSRFHFSLGEAGCWIALSPCSAPFSIQ